MYKHAYGFEQLPLSTVKSMRFNKVPTVLPSEFYQNLVSYYQEYFDSDPHTVPYIYGKDDKVACVTYGKGESMSR